MIPAAPLVEAEFREVYVQNSDAGARSLGVENLNTRLAMTDISMCDRYDSGPWLRRSRLRFIVARPANSVTCSLLTVTCVTVQSVACIGFYCAIRNVDVAGREAE